MENKLQLFSLSLTDISSLGFLVIISTSLQKYYASTGDQSYLLKEIAIFFLSRKH